MDRQNELVVRHELPYFDQTHLSTEEQLRAIGLDTPVEHSHTVAEQIGRQLAAGFVITDFSEARNDTSPTGGYLPG